MSEETFSTDERERYSRHFALPDVGAGGQARLKSARVLVVGAGGLGSPVALYLAAAGVGTIGIVDHDVVSLSNLQRQVLYTAADVGKSKVHVARSRLLLLNPGINVVTHEDKLDSSNALSILGPYSVVVDCTDNFPTRYLINDACVLAGRINVHGSVFRHEGQVSVFGGSRGPCYRCLYPSPPAPGLVQDCSQAGVFGALTGIIGSLQAGEVLKCILGIGTPLAGRLLIVNALNAKVHEMKVGKDPRCLVCGENKTITSLTDYDAYCSGTATSSNDANELDISVTELNRRLQHRERITLLDVREPFEQHICSLGGTLIPLHELDQRKGELDPRHEVIVYCHHGMRSQHAAVLLRRSGFSNVKNLEGGIDAWSREIDTRMPRY